MKRQPALSAAIAAALLFLVAGATVSTVKWRQAVAKQRYAQERAEDARQRWQLALTTIRDVVADIQVELKDRPDQQELRKKVLSKSLDRLRELTQNAAESARDPNAARSVDHVQIVALLDLGKIFLDLDAGALDDARQVLELAHGLAEGLVHARPESLDARLAWVTARTYLGDVRLATGDVAAARDLYRASLADARSIDADHSADSRSRYTLATGWERWGRFQSAHGGDTRSAADAFQQVVDILTGLADAQPGNVVLRGELATVALNAGGMRLNLGDSLAAEAAFRRARDTFRTLRTADPNRVMFRSGLRAALADLGLVQQRAGDLDAALASYQEGLAEAEDLARLDPRSARTQRDLGDIFQSLGEVRSALGDGTGARDAYLTSRRGTYNSRRGDMVARGNVIVVKTCHGLAPKSPAASARLGFIFTRYAYSGKIMNGRYE